MDKLKMHSINKVDSNIANIGKLFPNCLTERKNEKGELEYAIDFDMLRQELSNEIVEGNEERYQFTWPDKKQSILLANAPIAKTLRPCVEESVDFDSTENLYIEGDNLDVLKLLQETYLGKVKMIYIDPPYNTGNDFVYEDDFAQNTSEYLANSGQYDEEGNRLVQNNDTNGRFHTDWLNMIYPRLKVAKDLLTDDGVIFISIDDNEVENLKKVCNEVFGEDNFINEISVNMNSLSGVKMTHAIKGKRYPAQKEYILLYKKSIITPSLYIEKKEKGQWDKEYNMIIPELEEEDYERFKYLTDSEVNAKLSKMRLISLANYANEFNIDLTEKWKFNNAYRIFGTKSNTSLVKKVKDNIYTQQIICYTNNDDNKRYFRSDFNKITKDPRIELVQAESNLSVFISDNWIDISNDGGVAQEGGVIYPNGKKPLELIKRIIKASNDKKGLYLDFFAGSSTTAHAVMQLNIEDKGNRKFIMVQLPENLDENLKKAVGKEKEIIKELTKFLDNLKLSHNICEIGKERIRRAGKKIKEENKDKEGIEKLDAGFRVLKLDSTNMKDVYYSPTDYSQDLFDNLTDNIKPDRTPQDLLFQVMLDLGVLLSSRIEENIIEGKKVFNVNDNYLIACFDNAITDATIKAIAQKKPYYFAMRDSSVENDSVITNFEQLFATYSPDTIRKVL